MLVVMENKMSNKVNNMWRYTPYGGEDYYTAECLSCKNGFDFAGGMDYKFCPNCGMELKKEFTKKNKRWSYCNANKRPFPTIQFEYLETITHERNLNNFSFFDKYEPLLKPKYQWKSGGWPGYGFLLNPQYSKLLDRHIEHILRNYTNNPAEIRFTIKRYDGTEKTIYCNQFKKYTKKRYKPIRQINYDGPICSGSTLKMSDLTYIKPIGI